MAPQRPRKQKSSGSNTSNSANIPEFPMPPSASKLSSPARTPTRSPIKRKAMAITYAQKQALIDNLQLEITERARKLRAQYADQAHSLRSRLEMRISRVPKALRVVKMGEIILDRSTLEAKKVPRAIARGPTESKQEDARLAHTNAVASHVAASKDQYAQARGTKRTSDESFSSENKENAVQMELSNPKKRTKTIKPEPPRRAADTKLQDNQILSPKSSNSRTLPKSPVRPGLSPGKSFLARPVSPLKQGAPQNKVSGTLGSLVDKAKNIRTIATKKTIVASSTGAARTKRGAQASKTQTQSKDRDTSSSSSNSTGTIITAAKGSKAPIVKKTTTAAATRKVPPKAEVPSAAKRALRKRN